MGDYVRWAPPYYGDDVAPGARDALGAVPVAEPRQALDPPRPQVRRRARGVPAPRARGATSCSRASAPACSTGSGSATSGMREDNPGLVYCAITGYGPDGPNTARAGHDTNYLALNGLLGLTGAAGRPAGPVGGPDRRPRRRRADGGLRDPRRAVRARALGRGPVGRRLDDRRRALVAGDGRRRLPLRRRGARARRGACSTAGSPVTCPTSAPTAGSAAARSSRSSGRRSARASSATDLLEHQFAAARLATATPRSPRSSARRTKAEWAAFNDEHDCCIEPVLDLDEALDSDLVREREMVVELEQPELGPVRLLGDAGEVLAHARRRAPARPGPGRAHRGGARRGGLSTAEEIAALLDSGRRRRAQRRGRRAASRSSAR